MTHRNPTVAIGCLAIGLSLAFGLALAAQTGQIPVQNRDKATPPPKENAREGAEALLEAIALDNPALAQAFFFPLEAFRILKASANPARYHKLLLRYYAEDIAAERPRFKQGPCTLEMITLGPCQWMAPGTEGNHIAYWACRRNTLTARCAGKRKTLNVHTLINWGDRWYITHLGPIRR